MTANRHDAASSSSADLGPGARATHVEQGAAFERAQGLREDYEGQVRGACRVSVGSV